MVTNCRRRVVVTILTGLPHVIGIGMDMERPMARFVPIASLLVLLTGALLIGWVGFTASDDALYYTGAVHWIEAPPFAGDNHWSTRFPLLWSFAAMLLLLGRGFAAFAATALLWYAVLVALTGLFVRRLAGDRAGWIAAVLAGTMPVVIANATTVSVDPVEASALIGGIWLLSAAERPDWRALLAGTCFGVAVLCRETAILSVAGLAPLFLIGQPLRRDVLIAAGIGFAAVLGAEALFQYAMTGVPLRRYDIAFHHDSHIDRAANLEGNFLLHPAIDPLLVLLINDDFGLIFWAAIGAGGVAWRRRAAWPTALIVLAAMALADFLLVGVLTTKLVLNPRYFTLSALFAVVMTAIWLDRLATRWRWAISGVLVLTNLALLSVGNRHPRWEVEALLAAAQAHPGEQISADPVTVRRAAIPLAFAGLGNARYAPAPPNGLRLVAADHPAPGMLVARYPSPPTTAGQIVLAIGAERLVPGAIRRRLLAPSPAMALIRTPAR